MSTSMKVKFRTPGLLLLVMVLFFGAGIRNAEAVFDSGSLCSTPTDSKCLGDFNPAVNTVIPLPPDGILDYITFTVPAGVIVTFQKNANNTPVFIRTTGNVTIKGAVTLNGMGATCSGTACDGNLGDDGQPGIGGPGGFDGGFGGYSAIFGGTTRVGGAGKGPGGGNAVGGFCWDGNWGGGAGGGGFNGVGGSPYPCYPPGGTSYGQPTLLPLVGGSGGGGGGAGINFSGGGGGGGGGAITIASSGQITVGSDTWCDGWGYIQASGGSGGSSYGDLSGGGGGGGSGGAIRLVAETVSRGPNTCNTNLYADGGAGGGGGYNGGGYNIGGGGAAGFIRIEANTMLWSGGASPGYSFGTPGHVFVPSSPTLSIVSVATISVGPNPTGSADIVLSAGTTTATVNLAATNIPRGTTVTVYVVPSSDAGRSSSLSNALDGASDAATTATANVNLSPGNNVLMAVATYTVTEIIAMNLPTFDNGIRVAKIRVESTMGGASKMTYITASGKEYPADSPHRDKPRSKKNVRQQKAVLKG